MSVHILTQAQLKELLKYNPETGVFTWLVDRGRNKTKGTRAESIHTNTNGHKYRILSVNGKSYKQHRLAWLYVHGLFPVFQIDHKDGDGLNNRIGNLRDSTVSINQKNAKKRKDNTSGYTGVSFYEGKWQARLNHEGRQIYLGGFMTQFAAVYARHYGGLNRGFTNRHGC